MRSDTPVPWLRLCTCLPVCLATMIFWPLLGQAETPKPIDFSHDIIPLIKARCGECHTNGKTKGALSLDTRQSILRAKVVVPGKSSASVLMRRITSNDPEKRMPPKGDALTAKQVEQVRAWIDQGFSWQEGFSFRGNSYIPPLKPRRPTLPTGTNHPIDRLVDAYYAQHKITPPPPLDDVAFLRRLFLDVIGLLPATEERNAFLTSSAPDKRDQLIRQLLAERRAYADHWLTFWNDLLRNDYQGTGYIDGGRKQITPWLYQSLLDNKPYNQFVRELINPTPASAGFSNGIKWRGRVNASQVREVQFAQNIGQVFFGVNIKCASCHDSFIDSWKLDDAYGLAAVIADTPLEIHRCDKPTGKKATPHFLWPELGDIDPALPKAKRLERLAELVTHPDNGRFARTIVNRVWDRLMGRGIVYPVDVMANRPWNEDLLDYLAVYLVEQGHDVRKLIEHIVTSRAYQSRHAMRKDEAATEEYVFHGPLVKRMTAEQFLDAIWMITGTAPTRLAAPVKPPEEGPKERQFVRAALVNADPLMRSLGRPNREQVVTKRGDLLTTLQALDLANGPVLFETLNRGAGNLLHQKNEKPGKVDGKVLIETLYQRALCRKPTPEEGVAALEILGNSPTTESVADLLWAVFMLPEFQLIR